MTNAKTIEDLARETCAKLIPHTTSVHNVEVVANALREVRRYALKEAFLVFRTSSSYADSFSIIQRLMDKHD